MCALSRPQLVEQVRRVNEGVEVTLPDEPRLRKALMGVEEPVTRGDALVDVVLVEPDEVAARLLLVLQLRFLLVAET